MNGQVRQLEPAALWNNFADLNAVPRPSKKEERVIRFMQAFGESLGLPVHTDETGNIIIRKPATPGMEDRATVVLQSHLDMVHQKNEDTIFDFDNQGIDMYVEGDWVKARGTTLGADNGIGVAAIMSLLASADIPHPALEALFTIDEETGMTGALALQGGLLSGSMLLNLDTEEDNELTIGCAGGMDVTAACTYAQQAPTGSTAFRLQVKGLTGGHSGMDIHKGRGNANKLLNRILLELSTLYNIQLSAFDGGSLRNAIPREATALFAAAAADAAAIQQTVEQQAALIKTEYSFTDPLAAVVLEPAALPARVMDAAFQQLLLRSIYSCPNGIYRMSPDIAGLVQSSNNIARVLVKEGSCSIQCLTRSSVNSEKDDLARSIACAFELAGATVSRSSAYPGWQPKPGSAIVQLMSSLYKELYGEAPHVNAVHAGLECGILGTNYPEMQMISFGPNIHGAHSPDERVQISSVQKFWQLLQETLRRIPAKN